LVVVVLAPLAMAWYWPRGGGAIPPVEEVSGGRRR
jgi:hypothetical protein